MFKKHQEYAIVDFESYSECDLKKCGSWEYSKHPTTEILCVSVMVGTAEEIKEMIRTKTGVRTWFPVSKWSVKKLRTLSFVEFVDILNDKTLIKVAHNVMFEKAIIMNVLPKYLK